MWALYTPLQRWGFYSIGGILLLAMGFIGRLHLSSRPELVLNAVSESASQTSKDGVTEVFIHVVGAVKKPGLVRLPASARVNDAIEKAGGPTSDAQLNLINLAAKVEDGVQLEVPGKSAPLVTRTAPPSEPRQAPRELTYTPDPGPYSVQPVQASDPGPSPAGPTSTGLVSLNSATKAELDSLPGVGPVTADKILQYRQEHGGFRSVDELLAVKGIGPKKLEALRSRVQL